MARPSELRVHGVSGTPPREMLYSDPVSYDLSDRAAKVYEKTSDEWDVKAYHWGSLTAGSSITALWILLAPFAMANAAGWMMRRRTRLTHLSARIAALALTGLFFAQAANIMLDIPHDVGLTDGSNLKTTIFFVLTIGLVFFVGLISTQSTFRKWGLAERLRLMFLPDRGALVDDDAEALELDDPGAWAHLGDSVMWSKHPILHRLRRIHLTFGMAVISMVATMNGPALHLQFWLSVAVAILAVTALVLTNLSPASTIGMNLTLWLPATGWALLVAIAASLASIDLTLAEDTLFSGAGETVLAMVLAVVIASLPLLFTGSFAATGVLVAGAFIGASFGITGSVVLQSYFTDDLVIGSSVAPSPAEQVAAVGMLLFIVLVIALAFGFTRVPLTRLRPLGRLCTIHYSDDREQEVAAESIQRRAALRAQLILGIAGVAAILAALAGGLAALADMVGGRSILSSLTFTMPWEWEFSALGLTFNLGSLSGIALLLVVVVPAIVMLRSIIGGFRDPAARRKVGILWDLGSFWPRWYHPFGPPAYGPNAVSRLCEEIKERGPDVVAGHSQGSLISAVAIAILDDPPPNMGLVTYGSQLGILYPLMFPDVGIDALTNTLNERLDERWVNLWRRSDQVGGHHVKELGERNWHVDVGRGHSQYELTPDFRMAREAVLSSRDGNNEAPG